MVKGVHKKILEINHPDSLYFERAVFYLKPGITQLPPQVSQEDADALLQEISPSAKKRTRLWLPMLLLAVGSSVGTAAVILFFLGNFRVQTGFPLYFWMCHVIIVLFCKRQKQKRKC